MPVASHRWVTCLGPPRSARGLLARPRRPAPRPTARKGAPVFRCHHHHHHSNSSNSSSHNSKSGGRPASRVTEKSRAPSKYSPFFHEPSYHADGS
jgi:hypothetical protein